jgi:hypothetical protein
MFWPEPSSRIMNGRRLGTAAAALRLALPFPEHKACGVRVSAIASESRSRASSERLHRQVSRPRGTLRRVASRELASLGRSFPHLRRGKTLRLEEYAKWLCKRRVRPRGCASCPSSAAAATRAFIYAGWQAGFVRVDGIGEGGAGLPDYGIEQGFA